MVDGNYLWAERLTYAESKALDLLFEFLTPEQQEEYLETDAFTFTAKSGKKYRIGKPLLWELDQEGLEKISFCIHPLPNDLPKPDKDLNILLWLMADERKVRASAGSYGGARRLPLVPRELHRVAYREFDGAPTTVRLIVSGVVVFLDLVAVLASTPFWILWELLRRLFERYR